MSEIKKFLEDKKLKFRETETHFQLDCFLCTDTRDRLGIDKESHAWHCFNCHSKGSKLSTLTYAHNKKNTFKTKDKIESTQREKKCTIKKNIHVRMYKRIFKTKENGVAKYLINKRGLSKEAIKHFKLGVRSIFKNKDGDDYDAGEHLVIPYLKDGRCVNLKYRSIDPETDKKFKWRREKGGISALLNDEIIDDLDYDEIYIVESELDAISLWQLGIKNVVGLTTGAEGFQQPWFDRLERFKKIILVMDNDIAGQDGAVKLAKRLGLGRCHNVILPDDVKDPNDFLLKYDLRQFEKIVNKAQQFAVEDVVSLRNIMNNIYNKRFIEDNEEVKGYTTPWRKVNKVLGPLKPGYLKVIAGKPKSGKSTVGLNLMRHWANNNIPVGMYSCEMRTDRLGEKFVQMEIPDLPNIEEITPLQVREAQYKLPLDYLHFYYPKPGDLTIEKVAAKIVEMVSRYGLKIFIFDNLHFLCRGENERALVDEATQTFKLLAEALDIVFILIAHPKKTGHNKQLKTDDLKGSGAIFQDADVVWLMHRPFVDNDMTPDEVKSGSTEGAMTARTEISITGRWTEGGKTFLAFNGSRALFKDKGELYNEIAKELGKKKKTKKGM